MTIEDVRLGIDDPRRERPLDGRHAARDAAHRQGPRPALARRKRIIVDLAAVSQIDSSGLCDVVTAHTAAVRQDGALKLIRLPARIRTCS